MKKKDWIILRLIRASVKNNAYVALRSRDVAESIVYLIRKYGGSHINECQRQLEQEAISERKQSQRQQFTQEELIVEAIKYTETDNSKWINARKRSKEEAAQLEKSTNSKKSSSNQQPISRFHSRRGCNTTITFMNMDYLPEILTRRQTSSSVGYSTSKVGSSSPRQRRTASESIEYNQQKKKDEKCVITGKIAKYRDPKSMLGYHDLDSYKELRRRIESGELKLSRPGVQKKNGKKLMKQINILKFKEINVQKHLEEHAHYFHIR
jgi:hypothetical protein